MVLSANSGRAEIICELYTAQGWMCLPLNNKHLATEDITN